MFGEEIVPRVIENNGATPLFISAYTLQRPCGGCGAAARSWGGGGQGKQQGRHAVVRVGLQWPRGGCGAAARSRGGGGQDKQLGRYAAVDIYQRPTYSSLAVPLQYVNA
jgi:hypothetical protein